MISPISEEGSDIRQEADKILWVIKGIAEKHSFSAIRVDEVAGTTVITDEIKNFITQSGMCVCVLTETNPNVFYETGLRHSTGKPYIHLMRKGNDIPFDLKGISTIFYGDLDSFEEVKSLTERLDSFFETEKIKLSVEEDRDKLDIILDVLKDVSSNVSELTRRSFQPSESISDDILDEEDPMISFILAAENGKKEIAEKYFAMVLPRLDSIRARLGAAQRLAATNSKVGTDYIIENLSEADDLSLEDKVALLSGVIQTIDGSESGHYKAVMHVLDAAIDTDSGVAGIDARCQKQRLLYQVDKFEEAMEVVEELISLVDDEPSYYFNASLVYEELGLISKAKSAISKMLKLDKGRNDPDHLSQAVDIYIKSNDLDKAKEIYSDLKTVAPKIAAVKALDASFRDKLGLTRR